MGLAAVTFKKIKQSFLVKLSTFVFMSIKHVSVPFFLRAQLILTLWYCMSPLCPYKPGSTVKPKLKLLPLHSSQ